MMKKFHDLKRHFSRPRNELPTTSFQYRHRREGDRYAFLPRHVQAKLYIHVNTNQMKAILSPPIHKVDLEILSVHITSPPKILKLPVIIFYYLDRYKPHK